MNKVVSMALSGVAAILMSMASVSVSAQKASSQPDNHFWLGADISGTTDDESRGHFSYNSKGVQTENTALMKELGLDAVRLRVWVNPERGFSSKEDVLEMAKRAKANDMAIMIDFHYSDWWADPGKQNIPAAWKDMSYEEMKKALADHTRETLQLLKDNGIDVKWVQVGNETTNGLLWPVGHSDNMAQYAGFITAGYDAVKEVYPEAIAIVHLDNGFDQTLYDRVLDGLKRHGAKWDMVGMSLYPYWTMEARPEYTEEMTIDSCVRNMKHVASKYNCPVMLVEVGYHVSRPDDGREYLLKLMDALENDTDGKCMGIFYWAPELEDGQYPLGAFKDHRPTAIMDAFTQMAKRRAR